MPAIRYEKRQRIKDQALQEIAWARTYKQGKTRNWQLNENLYYGRKLSEDTSRANVDLGRMQEFVHTLLSKIDNPLVFKFVKRKESQRARVNRLNALRAIDQQRDDWDIKDIAGKKQAIIYGRAIYSYAADSLDGYCAHLENVDVYDFLVDPSVGGIDLERAGYLGRYGVVKMRHDLEKGMKKGDYLRTETERLLEGSGNSADDTQETINQLNRTRDTNVWQTQKEIGNPDKYVFWEWYTTYEGERYYVLITELGGEAIRIEKLTDVFESNLWPFWSWASFVDLTEFWTPGYCDYVREPFMAQSVSVNQLLDNAEQRNKPQKLIDPASIKNTQQLKYQRGGNHIEVDRTLLGNGGLDQAFKTVEVPQLDTPLLVYDKLEAIVNKASGVTEGASGTEDGGGKATIYEGNQAAAADRFGLLNKSYSYGYKQFAIRWEHGVREHLTKKIAVDILGPNGVEVQQVSRKDIFRKDDEFGVMVESSNAETALSELEKRTKMQFLAAQMGNPAMSPQKAFEIGAGIVGFDDDTIRQLMDTSEFGDAEIMSEAERDIERILDGEDIKPNMAATNAYKQRFIDYMAQNEENVKPEQAARLFAYMDTLDPIIMQNMDKALSELAAKSAIAPPEGEAPPPEMTTEDPMASINQLAPQGAQSPTGV